MASNPKPALAFEIWKTQLEKDCERNHKLLAFSSMGDTVLKLLWDSGLEPTVQSIACNDNAAGQSEP
jgi:hypothetical protein